MFSNRPCAWRASPEQWLKLQRIAKLISKSTADQMAKLEQKAVGTSSDEAGVEALIMAIYLLSSPYNLDYVTLESRRKSFENGEWEGEVSWESLANAGFFSYPEEGTTDNVKCFFCDVGLNSWEKDDDIVAEHARHSPLCFFVKASYGMDFVRNACGKELQERKIPRNYTLYDHAGLLKILVSCMKTSVIQDALSSGFGEDKVLLLVARRHVRDRLYFESVEEVSVGLGMITVAESAVSEDFKNLHEVCKFCTADLGESYELVTCFNDYVKQMMLQLQDCSAEKS